MIMPRPEHHRRNDNSPQTPLSAKAEEVTIGNFTLTFERPEAWKEIAKLKNVFSAAWQNASGTQSLEFGHGKLDEGQTCADVAAAPVEKLTSHGFTVPVVSALPVILPDGSHAFSIYYPATSPTVDVFKYAFLKELNGHWFSMEFIAKGKGLDYAELTRIYAPFLSSFKVVERAETDSQRESEQITPPKPSGGRMPDTSTLLLKEHIKGASDPKDFGSTLSQQPGELTTFQTYNLMEVVMLSDRPIEDKIALLFALGKYVTQRAAHLNYFTPKSSKQEQAFLHQVSQVRGVLELCGRLQDSLSNILEYETEFKKISGVAGLQDNLRKFYLTRDIPVEDRKEYTDVGIPGRNFLEGTMEPGY